MVVNIYDKNRLIVGCSDRLLLDYMQTYMDGKKVPRKNQILIPNKSSPKIYMFKGRAGGNIELGEGVSDIIYKCAKESKLRRENINKIRDAYDTPKNKFDYDYKGKFESVLEHQKTMYNAIMYTKSCGILGDPGTCKTGAYLFAIDKLIQLGMIKKALVITLSDLKCNVLKEMSEQVPHLKGVVLKGKSQSNLIINKLYSKPSKNVDYDIYISNYESMRGLVDVMSDNYFDMLPGSEVSVIINKNESQHIKSFRNNLKVVTLVDSYQ